MSCRRSFAVDVPRCRARTGCAWTCSVHFEPWGTEFILLTGDLIIVRSEAFASGDVEISYVEGGISLAFTRDVPIEITDESGRQLSI